MAGKGVRSLAARRLHSTGDLQLAIPVCQKGLGNIILKPDSPDLIDGVKAHPNQLYPDDRGWFGEIQRIGQGIAGSFPASSTQISAAVSYAGTIKAFHYHSRQSDLWGPVKGMFQMALVDLRLASPTFGRRNTLYVGAMRPWQLLIPPGVAHGYKVIGSEDAVLVYLTDRFYDPSDEGRIPFDENSINYDWETQRK